METIFAVIGAAVVGVVGVVGAGACAIRVWTMVFGWSDPTADPPVVNHDPAKWGQDSLIVRP